MERYRVSKRMSNARNEGSVSGGAVCWGLTFCVIEDHLKSQSL